MDAELRFELAMAWRRRLGAFTAQLVGVAGAMVVLWLKVRTTLGERWRKGTGGMAGAAEWWLQLGVS